MPHHHINNTQLPALLTDQSPSLATYTIAMTRDNNTVTNTMSLSREIETKLILEAVMRDMRICDLFQKLVSTAIEKDMVSTLLDKKL